MPDNEYLKCLKSEVLRVKRKNKNEFKRTKIDPISENGKKLLFVWLSMIKRPFEKFERNSRLNENLVILGAFGVLVAIKTANGVCCYGLKTLGELKINIFFQN